jgi:hypothetical protein
MQAGDVLRLYYDKSYGPWLAKVEAVAANPPPQAAPSSSSAMGQNFTLDLSAGRRVYSPSDSDLSVTAGTAKVTLLRLDQTSQPVGPGWFHVLATAFAVDLPPSSNIQSIQAGAILQIDLAQGPYLFQVAASQFAKPDPGSSLATGLSGEIIRLTSAQLMPLVPQTIPSELPTRVELLQMDVLFRYGTSVQQLVAKLGYNAGHSRFFGTIASVESSPLVSKASAGESPSPLSRGTYGPGYVAPGSDDSDDINAGDGGGPTAAGNDSIRDPALVAQLAGFVAALAPVDGKLSLANVAFLPLGMDDVFTPVDFTGPDPSHIGNDDLATFNPTLFYDKDLVGLSSTAATLMTAAFNLRFAQSPPVALRGLHSLLFEDEVALVALPDATQRNWGPQDIGSPIQSPPAPPAPIPACAGFADCVPAPASQITDVNPPVPAATAMLPLADSPAHYNVEQLLVTHQVILTFCQARADVMGILSLPSHFRTADCLDWQARFRGRSSLSPRPTLSDNLRGISDHSYVAVYHPWMRLADPNEPDGLREVPPDGAACGLIAARERARGVWVAAGNLPVANVLGLTPSLPAADLPDLFDRRFNLLGTGYGDFRVIGAHTLGDGTDLLQMSVRRLMILLRKVAQIRGMHYVFRNNDRLLAESVRAGMLAMLQGMFELGAFAGDTPQNSFRVLTGSDVNTPQSLALGQFIVVIQVAPSQPLEFMTVVLVRQSDGGLQIKEG